MKIVALLPFKNEKLFIRSCALSLCSVVDEIVAVDDFSKDNGRAILTKTCEEQGVPLHLFDGIPDKKEDPVEKLRTKLLNHGREVGGTHFVCLDADEAFTQNFCAHGKKIISKLAPGQKLQMQWLAMWKSLDHYKDDNTVWSNNFKDFVVCDNGNITAEEGVIHKGRTPGPNTEETLMKLNPKYGAVFHYQFADWKGFQMKQAWYRCFERSIGRDAKSINQTYAITLDDPNSLVKACPESWLRPAEELPNIRPNMPHTWHLSNIKQLFEEHGVDTFKDLDIWHIKEIRDLKR